MTQTTLPGVTGMQKRELSQWFTPPALAERIAEWALQPYDDILHVLEPSAGRGALALPLRTRGCRVVCVDLDMDNITALARQGFQVAQGDFLALPPPDPMLFALAVMNPPFEDGQAEAHILHALKWADRVVAHVPLTTLEGQERRRSFWSQLRLNRLAICASRAKYGPDSGATAMCTIDVSLCKGHDCSWPNVEVEVWL